MSVTVALSVSGLTTRAAAIAGLAIAALLLAGWRKPARATPRSTRGARSRHGIVVDHFDGEPYRRPRLVRRLFAAAASVGLAVMLGVLAAIVIAFGIAVMVIRLTGLLQS